MPRDYRLYLDDILECVEKIASYVAGMDVEKFSADPRTVDAVVRNLEIIGEAVRSLPEDVKDKASEIEWRKIASLRNILVHEYFGVNVQLVWDVTQTKLPPLRDACKRMLDA
jgi:uncharacterized protein with HEPN domain